MLTAVVRLISIQPRHYTYLMRVKTPKSMCSCMRQWQRDGPGLSATKSTTIDANPVGELTRRIQPQMARMLLVRRFGTAAELPVECKVANCMALAGYAVPG
jgi:hypothetical protein